MSKHDTILKNLYAITRCRSQRAAMSDWTVSDKIALPSRREPAACELCGTRFRRGAVVTRPVPRSKKPITLTVGENCLVTLLEHQFGERRVIAKRRAATTDQVNTRYAGLIDAGSWTVWVYEHAPRELVDLASRLKHVGALRTDAELKRLVAFHDGTRKYPAEAILPSAEELRASGEVDEHLQGGERESPAAIHARRAGMVPSPAELARALAGPGGGLVLWFDDAIDAHDVKVAYAGLREDAVFEAADQVFDLAGADLRPGERQGRHAAERGLGRRHPSHGGFHVAFVEALRRRHQTGQANEAVRLLARKAAASRRLLGRCRLADEVNHIASAHLEVSGQLHGIRDRDAVRDDLDQIDGERSTILAL